MPNRPPKSPVLSIWLAAATRVFFVILLGACAAYTFIDLTHQWWEDHYRICKVESRK
jgi:hypothetical protein